MKLPKHINLIITHNPHAGLYQTAEQWLKNNDHYDADQKDIEEILASGEIWEIHWYPNNPVGFHCVIAATLDRALELANACENASA